VSEITQSGITVEDVRRVVRAKVRDGVSQSDISLLIKDYVGLHGDGSRKDDGGAFRPAIEGIPAGRRAAFLVALHQLRK
jgi:hypothetical protein